MYLVPIGVCFNFSVRCFFDWFYLFLMFLYFCSFIIILMESFCCIQNVTICVFPDDVFRFWVCTLQCWAEGKDDPGTHWRAQDVPGRGSPRQLLGYLLPGTQSKVLHLHRKPHLGKETGYLANYDIISDQLEHFHCPKYIHLWRLDGKEAIRLDLWP